MTVGRQTQEAVEVLSSASAKGRQTQTVVELAVTTIVGTSLSGAANLMCMLNFADGNNLTVLPVPDGAYDSADIQHLLDLYCGILAVPESFHTVIVISSIQGDKGAISFLLGKSSDITSLLGKRGNISSLLGQGW